MESKQSFTRCTTFVVIVMIGLITSGWGPALAKRPLDAAPARHSIPFEMPSACPVPLTGVGIEGPLGITSTLYIDTVYAFESIITPTNATTPITYTWIPTPVIGQGTESATYQWSTPDTYTITLTAENCGGPVVTTRTLVVQEKAEYFVYLPLVQRQPAPPPWVDTQDREASQTLYLEGYLGSANSDSGWTGNHATCGAGVTSETFRTAILRRINYFRSMAGIPLLTRLNDTYNHKAQAAALMMSVNRTLSHSPDSSWTCYTEDGREGAGSSNLYLGVYGPTAISGYIYDPGSGNYFVGHRRWILYPQTQLMGTGDIPPRDGYPASNALWVFDRDHMWGPRPETRETFVAWPPPGYVPYQVVYPRWSFAYPQAEFNQATVMMTCGGQLVGVQKNTPVNGYGENTLVWEPQTNFSNPSAADTYCQVNVNNVLIETQPRNFTYTVIIFDPGD